MNFETHQDPPDLLRITSNFGEGPQEVLIIDQDGHLRLGDGITVDRAAAEFVNVYQVYLERYVQYRIREALVKVGL